MPFSGLLHEAVTLCCKRVRLAGSRAGAAVQRSIESAVGSSVAVAAHANQVLGKHVS